MKSPITGKEMRLTKEVRSMHFRKEKFDVFFHFYKCEETGEQFTTTALDELNLNQVYNQYRDKFNIPFVDEILRTRAKYGLTASKMSLILGFGINSYRQYEAGEMPSVSNARLIQMIDDPKKFIEMVSLCDVLEEKTKIKYISKAQLLLLERKKNNFKEKLINYLFGETRLANIYTGYRIPNFEKFTEMVVYFSHHVRPFKTKMNKLLFYADFLMFKQSGFSISGASYQAIKMGPVPVNFQSIFEYIAKNDFIDITYLEFPNGSIGELFEGRSDKEFNPAVFTEIELEVLNKVCSTFKKTSTKSIIDLSHCETAWIEYEETQGTINYECAFDLQKI